MGNIEEYKIAKYDLKNNFEQVLNSSTDDNCISSLKRLRQFFNDNEVIKSVIEDLTKNKNPLDLNDFLVTSSHSVYFSIKEPEDIGVHILTMNELIDYLCSKKNTASQLGAFLIPRAGSNKIKYIIEHFLREVFLPLYKYINGELEKGIIIMGEKNNGNVTVNQTIHGNGNTVTYSGRDSFINGQALKETEEDLKSLIEKALQELTNVTIGDEEKDSLADDLETLSSEINEEKPKTIRFKKIKNNIDSFISSTDETLLKSVGLLGSLTSIATKIGELLTL